MASRRSYWVAYALTFFLGFTGLQHLYLGYRGRARAYAWTLGWLTLGWLWDLFAIPFEVAKVNRTLS
ncbi:TM2 domain-containing protein [Leifsonia sp. EB34]|uniref:TM2 domain-containing protein n=1 Tax=Leifsonia sp. EB34 TaxID=3156303 RepID=UPI00351453E7